MAAKIRKKEPEFSGLRKSMKFVRNTYNWVIGPWCTAYLAGYLYLSFTRGVALYLMHPFWTYLTAFSFLVVGFKIVSIINKILYPGGDGFTHGAGYL